jgi:hypothetical protein
MLLISGVASSTKTAVVTGCHLDGVSVSVRLYGCCCASAFQEGDVIGSSAKFRGFRLHGDGEDGETGDGLSYVGVAQHSMRIRQDGLVDGARGNKLGQVLRQSGVLVLDTFWATNGGTTF